MGKHGLWLAFLFPDFCLVYYIVSVAKVFRDGLILIFAIFLQLSIIILGERK